MGRIKSIQLAAARPFYLLIVVVMSFLLSGQVLPQSVNAAQILSRKIVMSSSAPSAASTTYTVTFTPQATMTNPDVIIDFCANTPIIADSCTATAGTNVPNMTSAA